MLVALLLVCAAAGVRAAAAGAGAAVSGAARGAGRGGPRNLLLREIKDNLRHDNEDYELVRRRTGGAAPPQPRPPTTHAAGAQPPLVVRPRAAAPAAGRPGAPPHQEPGAVRPRAGAAAAPQTGQPPPGGARPAAPRLNDLVTAVPMISPKSRHPSVKPGRKPAARSPSAAVKEGPFMRASDLDGFVALAEDLDEAGGPVDLPAEPDVRLQVAKVTSAVRRHARRPMDEPVPAAGEQSSLAPELAALLPDATRGDFQLHPIQPSPRPRHHRAQPIPRAHPAPPPPSRPVAREGPPDRPTPAEPATDLLDDAAVSTTTASAANKKDKLERFVVFINKNRELLKQFIQNKRAQLTKTQAPSLRIAAGVGAPGADAGAPETGVGAPGALGSAVMDGLRGAARVRLHNIARGGSSSSDNDSDKDKVKQVNVEAPVGTGFNKIHGKQLDLAPARGARIEHMRQKGRICSRHVLYPEGPKYNSRGHTYMPEYVPKNNRIFTQTRAPTFLLPACCNCCRKSALGCE